MLTYVLYALIAVSIIFLFIVISQLLRRRDMAQELAFYKQQHGGSVAEDGWGDWGDEDEAPSAGKNRKAKKKKKGKGAGADDGWGDEPSNTQTSWTDTHIGTPVQPSRRPAQHSDETKMYRTAPAGRAQNVPKDVTKDLSRVNKAEAKAMKKAAAAEAKAQEDARKAAAARAAEAKRQAEQARKLAQQNEAAREAQERAVEKAASSPGRKSPDKGVEIDMIDL